VAELELETRLSDGEARVVIHGEIDMATAPQFRETLDDLVSQGARKIVLDCRSLEFLDSSGIGVLVAVGERLGDAGSMCLDGAPAQVRKVLDLTGVSDRLELRD
jgi:anti-sigma B factor antagonist